MKKKVLAIVLTITLLFNLSAICSFAESTESVEKELYEIEITGTADYLKAYDAFDRINTYRSRNGFNTFIADKELFDAAMQRAAECAVYFSSARPDETENKDSFQKAVPEKFANGCYEYESAILKNIDDLFDENRTAFYNFLASGYKTVGIGIVYHNGIYFFVALASNVQGEEEKTRTLSQETTDFSIVCEKLLVEDIVTEPESLELEVGKTDSVFFEATNLGWIDINFIINPKTVISSDENIASAEILRNAVKVNALAVGESNITVMLNSVDGKNTLSGEITVSVKERTTDPGPTENPDILPGDVTGDGKRSVVDAKWMLQILAGSKSLSDVNSASLDVNGDGKLSVVDAKWVLQILAGIRDAETLEPIKK